MIKIILFIYFITLTVCAKEETKLSTDDILHDKEKRVHDYFRVPKYFEANVSFWYNIYTKHSFYEVLLHDSDNLNLVYNILDYNDIYSSNLNKYAKENLKKKLYKEKLKELRSTLKKLETKNFTKLNHKEFELVKNIRRAGLKIPVNFKKRKKFFRKLSSSVRSQSGQKDKIFSGILNSREYIHNMQAFVRAFKLPEEVLAIPFLESSFNLNAHSKADAVGIWQFMSYTNNLVMPRKSKYIDYRKNPIISTLAALHILKENKLILRSWDLAISAYNAGTKHLGKARKKYRKRKNLDLAFILENYQHPSLGFAVKNFYSEFLALAHTLAYREHIFPTESINTKLKKAPINIYVSKCRINPKKFFRLIKSSQYDIKELNAHFLKPARTYPRGSLVVSDVKLTSRKYYKLSKKEMTKNFPKKYSTFIKKHRCK